MSTQPSTHPTFSLGRTLKLGSFHLGSALADILVLGVWNRVLISDLGASATLVALLAALRFLLAPLTIWAGHRSDHVALRGRRRLPYILGGRLLLWLSLPLLPLALVELARDTRSLAGWGLALAIFLLYGVGTLLSGSPFLALVRASAPPARQGLAVVIVQTILLAGFAVVGILYSVLMESYTLAGFWQLVGVAMAGAGLAWLLSVWGEERAEPTPAATAAPPFGATLRELLGQPKLRAFFWLLATGSVALFAQDAILEPLGGDLFGLSVGETTRFNTYYSTGVLLAMVVGSALTRRWLPSRFAGVTAGGLVGLMATLALLAVAALGRVEALLVPGLFLFGLASGVYTVGGLSLMVAMTDDARAGAYLGLWSLAQLLFRGVGIALGGAVLDGARALTGSAEVGYAAVFGMELVAAAIALALLGQVRRAGYVQARPVAPDAALAAGD